jgi:DNA topoisomerase-1
VSLAGPLESAKLAGLRHVDDTRPGIRRHRAGRGFRYTDSAGRPVGDAETLRRIRALVIPPAWTGVWICPTPTGHVQAVGRDARGRKQYRYHVRWRDVRSETKYTRMLAFARALPRIRARVERDLAQPGLPREKVLATIVRLLETTLIRVGNGEYARANNSFGLTTLRNRHVDVDGAALRFAFRGKGGKEHTVGVRDPRLARIVRRLHALPGRKLFQYVDTSGERRTIEAADVNTYLREVAGEEFTAKDFRTWAGTVLAAVALAEAGRPASAREAKRNIVRAIAQVATRLGNTPAVCRAGYVHPDLLHAYHDGVTVGTGRSRAEGPDGEERLVLGWLRRRSATADAGRAA